MKGLEQVLWIMSIQSKLLQGEPLYLAILIVLREQKGGIIFAELKKKVVQFVRLEITNQSISRTTLVLQQKGLIVRTPYPKKQSTDPFYTYEITPLGEKSVDAFLEYYKVMISGEEIKGKESM
ncbi:MAG: hypothetical protein AAB567_00950 [Patescibacteria group bacterium]